MGELCDVKDDFNVCVCVYVCERVCVSQVRIAGTGRVGNS